ncbi:MAG: IS1182 family transposase, partial [Flavobacteriales bacterium]|nr:IS1182 family transposase [Flavobacteriales bacterium]
CSIDEYVKEDDPVRVYDAFIEALDHKELNLALTNHAVGPPSYDPIAMLKVLVYGYSYGWRSSRKLERALHHNLSFIWLSGGLKPDHKTIAEFRRNHKSTLKRVLKQCARMCLKLGLIEGSTLFVDGSKFRANAGKSQTKTMECWEQHREEVEHQIEELLNECQKTDDKEKGSLVKVSKELAVKSKLKNKIDHLVKEFKDEEKVNGTDPDSKIMKGRQGSHSGYNTQMVTDEAHGLIVSMDVSTSANDLNELHKQVKNAEETLCKQAQNICADAGYSSVNDIEPLLKEGRTVIVPNNKQAQKQSTEDPFSKEAFLYDIDNDIYICPNGQEMHLRQHRDKRNRLEYRIKSASICRACPHFGECTKSKSGRRLYRLMNEHVREHLANSYESSEGQQLYAKRKMRVELPFGHIKSNLGAGAFLLRGINGVKAEISLLGTCFNLSRMITIVGGVKPMIERLQSI